MLGIAEVVEWQAANFNSTLVQLNAYRAQGGKMEKSKFQFHSGSIKWFDNYTVIEW